MLNSQRAFVHAVTAYCARYGIAVDVRAQGWLIVMQRGAIRRLAYGYDLGLNSAVTHRIANDKAAAADVMEASGVPCVPHAIFLKPDLSDYVVSAGSWEPMLALFHANPQGVVVKPNEGTSGQLVFNVTTKPRLEQAVNRIFLANFSVAISPFLEIADEVRVILVDDRPLVVYAKQRPCVTGDGVRAVLDLVQDAIPPTRLATILSSTEHTMDEATLGRVLAAGEILNLHWRHNLDSGAEAILLTEGTDRDACVALAQRAARAINLRFGSVDLVRVDGVWRVLEINSGVMMESLSRHHPELVAATYSAALDRVFGGDAPI